MQIKFGTEIEIISPLDGGNAGHATIIGYDAATQTYLVTAPWIDDVMHFTRAEFRISNNDAMLDGIYPESFAPAPARLGKWEPSVRRGSAHDGWSGDSERWVRGMSRVIAKLV